MSEPLIEQTFVLCYGAYSDFQHVVYLKGSANDELLDAIYAEAYASVLASYEQWELDLHGDQPQTEDLVPAFVRIACSKHGFAETPVRQMYFGFSNISPIAVAKFSAGKRPVGY